MMGWDLEEYIGGDVELAIDESWPQELKETWRQKRKERKERESVRAQLKPYHHIQAEHFITIIDQLYISFNQEAAKHEADELRTLDVLKKIKSGEIKLDQIEVTDNAWDVMPAQMAAPAPDKANPNGSKNVAYDKAVEEAKKDAVPSTSRT